MKGKLIKAYSISENEMLAKDTEIEITNIYSGYNSNFYKGMVGDREVVIDFTTALNEILVIKNIKEFYVNDICVDMDVDMDVNTI